MAATVLELSKELKLRAPLWAKKARPLQTPWFVSGIENLKATALLESPLSFRSKNVFVLNNFLDRA